MQFHRKSKGALGENEDWWTYSDGTVRHTWHHMNPYTSTVTSEGSTEYTVEEFLSADVDMAAKNALKKLLSD